MKRRILIGEDDVNILKMTKLRLEHEGYTVITANDGQQVLDQTGAQLPIHLILIDIKMPRLNGYQVCQKLKAQAGTARIPVIIFSASESQLQLLANRCIEVGATDWIKKPFRTQELSQKIHQALGEEDEVHE
jgi:CheY-like chemotaxis protein